MRRGRAVNPSVLLLVRREVKVYGTRTGVLSQAAGIANCPALGGVPCMARTLWLRYRTIAEAMVAIAASIKSLATQYQN
jgi:hypothetical protein